MRPKRTDAKYWTGTRNFNHIQYESDLEDYIIDLENETQPSCLGAVMGSILKELEERKQWAENGMMVYSDDTGMRNEYQARIEEIENTIWVVSQYCP